MNRKKWIILINELTGYSLLIQNIVKRDLADFHSIVYYRLISQLFYDRIHVSIEQKKVLYNSEISFLPTNNNRRITGIMVQLLKDLEYYIHYSENEFTLEGLNHILTSTLISSRTKNKYEVPNDLMKELICKL